MLYNSKRIDNTDCHVFEGGTDEGVLTIRKYDIRKSMKTFQHGWWESQGYTEVAALNATYFGWDGSVVGGLYVDSGFYVSPFVADKKFITLIYENDLFILDECCDYDDLISAYPKANFMVQLGDPLVRDGKSYKGDGNFDHSHGRHPRSFIGQKKSGEIVLFATDGRGGDDKGFTSEELREIALDMDLQTAVMCDGGGSSTLIIEETMVNSNENRKVPTAFMFYAKPGYELVTEVEKSVKRIVLDAGHGMGTSGKRSPDGYREAQENYNIMFKLYELLNDDPEYDVMMTNDNMAYDMGLNKRCNLADAWDGDLFLSIHKDAFGDGSWRDDVSGIGTFVYSKTSDGYRIGGIMQDLLVEATGMKDRGIYIRPNLAVLRLPHMPSVLVELGFMTNRIEASQMTSAKWYELYAQTLYKGIKEAL